MTPALDLVFARVGGRTVLTRRRYRWPLLVGRVFDDERGGVLTVQNAAGTLIPGDVVRQLVEVVDGGVATVGARARRRSVELPTGAESSKTPGWRWMRPANSGTRPRRES